MDVSRHLFPWSQGLFHRAGWGLRLVLIPGLALIPQAASSGEWSSVFALSTTTSYEDNPTLAVDDETDNGQLLLRPSLTNRYEGGRYRIDLDANATLVRSTDQSVEEDTVRYGFDAGGEYDRDTGTISVALSLNLDSVQNTEFDDTGLLADSSDVTRTDSSLKLSLDQELNDKWRLNFSDDLEMVSFSGGNFTDSTNNSARLDLSYEYGDTLTLKPGIGYDRFDPEGGKPSNTYRLNMGGDYALSDISSVGLTLGGLLTDGELGWSAATDYNRAFENFSINADASRDVSPSSAGVLRESTSLGFGLTYRYSETTSAGFASSWRSSTVNNASNAGDTIQVELSPWVNWELSEDWSARLTYRGRMQKQPSAGTARSNSISIVFNYSLPIQ